MTHVLPNPIGPIEWILSDPYALLIALGIVSVVSAAAVVLIVVLVKRNKKKKGDHQK